MSWCPKMQILDCELKVVLNANRKNKIIVTLFSDIRQSNVFCRLCRVTWLQAYSTKTVMYFTTRMATFQCSWASWHVVVHCYHVRKSALTTAASKCCNCSWDCIYLHSFSWCELIDVDCPTHSNKGTSILESLIPWDSHLRQSVACEQKGSNLTLFR